MWGTSLLGCTPSFLCHFLLFFVYSISFFYSNILRGNIFPPGNGGVVGAPVLPCCVNVATWLATYIIAAQITNVFVFQQLCLTQQTLRRHILIEEAIFFQKRHLKRRLKQLHLENTKIRVSFTIKTFYIYRSWIFSLSSNLVCIYITYKFF